MSSVSSRFLQSGFFLYIQLCYLINVKAKVKLIWARDHFDDFFWDDGMHTRNSACACRSRGRRGAPRGASPRPLGESTAPHHANAVVTRNEHGDPMPRGIEHVLVRTHKELRLGRESRLH